MTGKRFLSRKNNPFWRLAVVFMLLAITLACGVPAWDNAEPQLTIRTATPAVVPSATQEQIQPVQQNEPPVPAVVTPTTPEVEPAAGDGEYTLVLDDIAQTLAYGSGAEAQSYCSATARVSLVIQHDGKAQLTATGPQFFDHINCTLTNSQETWIVEGAVIDTGAQVDFVTCNFGAFAAQGTISYLNGLLSGEVRCISTDGQTAVLLLIHP